MSRLENKRAVKVWSVSAAIVFLAVALVAALPSWAAGPAPDGKVAEGQPAPAFTLSSQEGKVNLADLHGKWVVLYFYPKDFTGGCTMEAHNFQRDIKEYEAKNTVILGVSVDDLESHKGFCAKEGLHFKLLADTDHTVTQQYDSVMDYKGMVLAARNTFIIDPTGVVRKIYKGVNPSKHSEEVLAALADLQKTQ